MKRLSFYYAMLLLALAGRAAAGEIAPTRGAASWYGEDHRGKLMANGARFDPNKLTAASWFYPLGTQVRVTAYAGSRCERTVLVTITDRGPSKKLVGDGRIIDLAHAAFKELTYPEAGLVDVVIEPIQQSSPTLTTASTR